MNVERDAIRRRNAEKCRRCGLVRSNVRHTVDRANSIEGPEYFQDVPFCPFWGPNEITPPESGLIVGRVVETPDRTFLEPLG